LLSLWVRKMLKLVNIWQSYKQERDRLVHFLRLLAVCWLGAQSAWDNHALACMYNFPKYSPVLKILSLTHSARPGWTTSRRGPDSPWKSQSEWQRTRINGESTSMVWPTLGSRTAKEQEQEHSAINLSGPTRHDQHGTRLYCYRRSSFHIYDRPLTDMSEHLASICLECADKNLIFAVLQQWLLQQTETEASFVYII